MFIREAQVRTTLPLFFTDSIYVCAVVSTGHALYKDIRLSGNGVRESWALGRQGHKGEEA